VPSIPGESEKIPTLSGVPMFPDVIGASSTVSARMEIFEVADLRKAKDLVRVGYPRGWDPDAPGRISETDGAIAHRHWRSVVFPTPFSPRMTVHFATRSPSKRLRRCSGPKQRTASTLSPVK
jgi:hypothetical protein